MQQARQPLRELLILWCSTTGGSEQLASAAEDAACQVAQGTDRLRVCRLHADDAQPADLLAADGFLFISPEHLGSLSGTMKSLFDRCYYPVLDQLNGRPYALIVCAGSDGEGSVRQVERIVTGWRLRKVAEPLIVLTHAQTPEEILAPKTIAPAELARAAELGAALAEGIASGIW